MNIKTINCNTAIEAEGLRSRLLDAGIECVTYDETNSKVARGILDSSIDVMVNEEDYERALYIYDEMKRESALFIPWCPYCGSEDVVLISHGEKKLKKTHFITAVLLDILAIVLFVLYIRDIGDFCDLALVMVFVSILLYLQVFCHSSGMMNTKYHCHACNKDFTKQ